MSGEDVISGWMLKMEELATLEDVDDLLDTFTYEPIEEKCVDNFINFLLNCEDKVMSFEDENLEGVWLECIYMNIHLISMTLDTAKRLICVVSSYIESSPEFSIPSIIDLLKDHIRRDDLKQYTRDLPYLYNYLEDASKIDNDASKLFDLIKDLHPSNTMIKPARSHHN